MLQTSSLPRNTYNMLSSPRLASSSSRTTRVLEELQESLENIQKEIKNTKAQLLTVTENKELSEKENEEFIINNKQLRSDIQEIMQVLESKQQLLDSTKKTYITTENKVKQLKDEAMSARKELDDLKRREHTIEKECNTIQLLKEKQVQQKLQQDQSVAQLKSEFEKELKELGLELEQVKKEKKRIEAIDISTLVKEKLVEQQKKRQVLLDEFNEVQAEIQLNNQQFINQVQEQLADLLNHLPQVSNAEELENQVINCKQDVDSLISRIKNNATIPQ